MNLLSLSIISLLAGLSLSALSSLIFTYCSKRKLSQSERLRVESLDSLDQLLSRAKGHEELSPDELQRVWSDAMNYIMTARSPSSAAAYLGQLKTALGRDAEPFATEAERILAYRLQRSECGVREAAMSSDRASVA
jgi:hypothetical protein